MWAFSDQNVPKFWSYFGHIMLTFRHVKRFTKMWPKFWAHFGQSFDMSKCEHYLTKMWPKFWATFGHIFLFISTTTSIVQERRNQKFFTNSKHLSYIYSSPAEVQSNTRWPIRSVTTFCWLWFGSSETNSQIQVNKICYLTRWVTLYVIEIFCAPPLSVPHLALNWGTTQTCTLLQSSPINDRWQHRACLAGPSDSGQTEPYIEMFCP